MRKTILITGAAGNLGGLLAKHLCGYNVSLHLLIHKKDVSPELKNKENVKVFKADLGEKESLSAALQGVDVIVHFAGVLFMHNPEKFLPLTNTLYFKNLVEKAKECNVKRIILISFPHVEGETTPEYSATGRLDGHPVSMHAKTRLEEEKLLFSQCENTAIEPVSLRLGMVYGKGILMIDTAHWFSAHYLLGIWKKPTYIHLISIIDYLNSTANAALKENIKGIYHLGDDGVQTLQTFLDDACVYWKTKKPWHMPLWMINTAASFFELWSKIFKVRSPLTRDFIKIGMVSYYGDTTRMRQELLPSLKYKTYKDGINTL